MNCWQFLSTQHGPRNNNEEEEDDDEEASNADGDDDNNVDNDGDDDDGNGENESDVEDESDDDDEYDQDQPPARTLTQIDIRRTYEAAGSMIGSLCCIPWLDAPSLLSEGPLAAWLEKCAVSCVVASAFSFLSRQNVCV